MRSWHPILGGEGPSTDKLTQCALGHRELVPRPVASCSSPPTASIQAASPRSPTTHREALVSPLLAPKDGLARSGRLWLTARFRRCSRRLARCRETGRRQFDTPLLPLLQLPQPLLSRVLDSHLARLDGPGPSFLLFSSSLDSCAQRIRWVPGCSIGWCGGNACRRLRHRRWR